MKKTTLLVCISLFINGVAAEQMESVSVMGGDTVTLHTDLTELQRQDVIEWRTGVKQELVAKINREANTSQIFNDIDGRFRDRLRLNNQNGDLTITNITTQLIGLYFLEITRQKSITKTFNVSGVFGVTDEMKSVSVKEGDSLTLHIDLSDRQKYDVIVWQFQHGNSPLAELNRKVPIFQTYDDVHDGIFRDKLKLDFQTGSLTITNIRTNHAGLYEVDFSSGTHTIHQSFTVTVNDEVKSKSVIEGSAVTLHTDLTKIQKGDNIDWRFGPQETLIAKINKDTNETSTHDDVLDGRFRDRLQVNDQTGDLTITNIRTDNFGLYELKMSSRRRSIQRKYNVNVSAHGLPPGAVAGILCVLIFLLLVAVAGVFYYRYRITKANKLVVKEGDSVILHTDLTPLEENHVIQWTFGPQNTLIAQITSSSRRISDDERFRGRLALRDQSGSLIINDARTTDTGLYKLKITRGRIPSYKRFKLTVTESGIDQPLLNEDGVSGTREASVCTQTRL
ncbi:uncharacterized protein [Paramisgurnus dabryanus]|uniref:uncharacterized protein n=1 Tax=Paramisgurnus dabryanus TaxID=90735 RepID=UPI0031F35690